MADRTVSVRLKGDVDDYKRAVRDAKAETVGLDGQVKTLQRDVRELTPETVKASRSVEQLGVEASKARDKTTGLGSETRKTGQNIVDLARDIDKTKAALKALGDEFQRTGQVNVDELKKLSNALRDLERAKDLIGKLTPGDGAKKKSGGLLDFAIDEWIAKLARGTTAGVRSGIDAAAQFATDHKIAAAIIGAIVVSAPAIGAAVNSAILLGIGGGALAAGIVLAARDPRVGDAWGKVGESAMRELTSAADVFTGPLIRSAQKFGALFSRDIMPSIRDDFTSLAPLVDKLTDGVAGFAKNLMPGIDKAIAAAGPFLEELANELPNIGNAISDFFGSMAAGAPGALQFFHDLLKFTQMTVVAVGNMVEFLSKTYALLSGLSRVMAGDLTGAMTVFDQFGNKGAQNMHEFRKASDTVVERLLVMTGDLQTAVRAAGSLKAVFDELNGAMLTWAQAEINVEEAVDKLGESLAKNGATWDVNTEKGRANKELLIQGAQAARDAAQARFDETGSLEMASVTYEAYKQKLIDSIATQGGTRRATDESRAAAKQLADQIMQMPDFKKIQITADTSQAESAARRLVSRINEMTARIRVSAEPSGGFGGGAHTGFGYSTGYALGGVRRAAVGMVMPPTDPGIVLASEPQTGGEVLTPLRGISRARAMSLSQVVGDAHGFDVVPRGGYRAAPMTAGGGSLNITITAAPGGTMVDQAMSSWFMQAVRTGQITLATDQGSRVRVG